MARSLSIEHGLAWPRPTVIAGHLERGVRSLTNQTNQPIYHFSFTYLRAVLYK